MEAAPDKRPRVKSVGKEAPGSIPQLANPGYPERWLGG